MERYQMQWTEFGITVQIIELINLQSIRYYSIKLLNGLVNGYSYNELRIKK